jgi:hypothetical protein
LLTVRDQIKDAEYFLQLLRSKYSREEVRPILTAFLAIPRSISDYLLEEYNTKLKLNILLTEKLTITKFRKEAKKQTNQIALQFIDFYSSNFASLRKNAIGSLIIDKRNIKIHRTDIPLHGNFKVNLQDTISISESIKPVVYDRYGNIKQQSNNNQYQDEKSDENSYQNINDNPHIHSELTKSQAEVKWFFSDYPTKEMPDVCQDFLNLMIGFVDKVYKKFP